MALEIRYATTVSYQEEGGVPRSVKTRHMVLGATNRGSTMYAEILADSACPKPGDRNPTWPNLILVGRDLEPIPERPDGAWLDLSWSDPKNGQASTIDSGIGPTGWSGNSNLTQISTQKDIYGDPIIVGHQWSASDPDWPNDHQVQGADVSVLASSGTLTVTGTLRYPAIHALCNFWRGSLNALPWAGYPAGAWLVTAANFTPLDVNSWPPSYTVTFEFSLNPEGMWDPVVWFTDPRTGRPAYDLQPDYGIKIVPWYKRVPFQYTFPYFRA